MIDFKQQLIDNLHIIFEYPYYISSIGRLNIDYMALDEDIFYYTECSFSKLKQLIQKTAISLIFLYDDHSSFKHELFQIDKIEFNEDDCFVFLFDSSCSWAIIHDHGNDTILLIGSNLVKCAKAILPNLDEYTVDWFNR